VTNQTLPIVRKQHAKSFHYHEASKVLLHTQWIYYRSQGKLKQSPSGYLCYYCGFIPNEETIERRLALLEQLQPQYGSESRTKGRGQSTKSKKSKPKG
jgi:hypothetical protein